MLRTFFFYFLQAFNFIPKSSSGIKAKIILLKKYFCLYAWRWFSNKLKLARNWIILYTMNGWVVPYVELNDWFYILLYMICIIKCKINIYIYIYMCIYKYVCICLFGRYNWTQSLYFLCASVPSIWVKSWEREPNSHFDYCSFPKTRKRIRKLYMAPLTIN